MLTLQLGFSVATDIPVCGCLYQVDLVRWQMNIAPLRKLDGTGISKDHKQEYLEVSVSKNNYGPPQSERLLLRRGDEGVLRYVHSSGQQDKQDKDVVQVLAVIQTQLENGKVASVQLDGENVTLRSGDGGTYLWVANPTRQERPVRLQLGTAWGSFSSGSVLWGADADVQGQTVTLTCPARDMTIIALA